MITALDIIVYSLAALVATGIAAVIVMVIAAVVIQIRKEWNKQ